MKFLLIIPVLAIFLSNVPFKMEMPVPSPITENTCSMDMQEAMHCSEDEPSAGEDCSQKESTCVCFCCFQVLVPTLSISKFRFQVAEERSLNGFYLQTDWNNPFIGGPLQPPDQV